MGTKFKRRKYLVNHSIQLKYITYSVLPALVMSFFCSALIMKSGELILKTEKEQHFEDISEITQTLYNISTEGCPDRTTQQKKRLMARLLPLQENLTMSHFESLEKWNKVKFVLILSLLLILICISVLALLASHKICGPLYRIKHSLDLLSEGKDIRPVRLRTHDELKDVAESLDKLRKRLKEKGFLEHEA